MFPAFPRVWLDSPQGYGAVSRILHWGMAAVFAWQFFSSALHAWDKEAAFARSVWPSHVSLGVVLLALVSLRALWAWVNRHHRPAAGPGPVGLFARFGHVALYGLMVAAPVSAMLRSYGRGKGLSVFGMRLLEATGQEIPSLIAVGNTLHGRLGWILLGLVTLHILMVGVHQYVWHDGTGGRMLRRG